MLASVIYFVVSTVLTIALAPRPPKPKSAVLTDFQLPTADQGRPIPVIFGTCNISGANCVWYGDLATTQVRVHNLFTSSVTGYQYFIGFHLVLGHGPFDSINEVQWDKKIVWQGIQTTTGQICLTNLNMFGGTAGGQGGIQGCFDIIMGTDTELQNEYLQSQLTNVPAFRGVTSAVWIGGNRTISGLFTNELLETTANTGGVGYIGTSPYIKAVEFQGTRILNGWNIPGGCWYSAKAVVTQSTTITSPPTWAPTFEYQIYDETIYAASTVWQYDATNPNFSILTQGYINIGTEWVEVVSVQYDSNGFQTGRMNVIRGAFGTTPAAEYPNNTAYYFYQTTNTPVQAMNPAHIVYQCLVEPRWGLGIPTSALDNANFEAAADTFYAEGMGLCMQWVNASTVQDFLKIVLDHCAANLVMTAATGLYQLIPIRGGYDVSTLPTFDETMIKEMTQYDTQSWADEVDQVTLIYTDPGTAKDTGIIGQDLGNLELQGKIVDQTVNYQGIRSHTLAAAVLGRELTSRCTPLIKITFTVNRSAWATSLGGLFKLNWAPRNVTGLVFRITETNKGKLEDNLITISAVQDIYSLGLYDYQTSSVITGGGNQPPLSLSIKQIAAVNQQPPQGGPSVLSASLTTPPANPNDGDRYLVPSGAVGAWAEESSNVAIWDAPSNSWVFVPIPEGVLVYNQETQQYVTSNGSGTIYAAVFGPTPTAAQISYDSSHSGLGATNVQEAIDVLAANIGSAIILQNYSEGVWYGEQFDGSIYTTVDGVNYLPATSTGEVSFNHLIFVPATGFYYCINESLVGKSTGSTALGDYVYSSVAGITYAWQGLVYLDELSLFVVWYDNVICTSSDAITWTNPDTAQVPGVATGSEGVLPHTVFIGGSSSVTTTAYNFAVMGNFAGLYVVASLDSGGEPIQCYDSPDGSTWTARSPLVATSTFPGVFTQAFLQGGRIYDKLWVSDAATWYTLPWASTTLPVGVTPDGYLSYLNGQFVFVGTNTDTVGPPLPLIATCANYSDFVANTWVVPSTNLPRNPTAYTTIPVAVTYSASASLYFLVANRQSSDEFRPAPLGVYVYSSPDLITFTQVYVSANGNVACFAQNGSRLVIGGTISGIEASVVGCAWSSNDYGATWTQTVLSQGSVVNSMVFDGTHFVCLNGYLEPVVVGNSTDGITWTFITPPAYLQAEYLYTNGSSVLVGAENLQSELIASNIWLSTDHGVTFSEMFGNSPSDPTVQALPFYINNIVYDDSASRALMVGVYNLTVLGGPDGNLEVTSYSPVVYVSSDSFVTRQVLSNPTPLPLSDNVTVNCVYAISASQNLPLIAKQIATRGLQEEVGGYAGIWCYASYVSPDFLTYWDVSDQGSSSAFTRVFTFDATTLAYDGSSILSLSGDTGGVTESLTFSTLSHGADLYVIGNMSTSGSLAGIGQRILRLGMNAGGSSTLVDQGEILMVGGTYLSNIRSICFIGSTLYTISGPDFGGSYYVVKLDPTNLTVTGYVALGFVLNYPLMYVDTDGTYLYTVARTLGETGDVSIYKINPATGDVVSKTVQPLLSFAYDQQFNFVIDQGYLYMYNITLPTYDATLVRINLTTMTQDTTFTFPTISYPNQAFDTTAPLWLYVIDHIIAFGNRGTGALALNATDPANLTLGSKPKIAVAMTNNNTSTPAPQLAYSDDGGTSWSFSTPTWPSGAHGLDSVVYDGTKWIVSGLGWSGVSTSLSSGGWTFSGATSTSNLKADNVLLAMYSDGLGLTGATVGVVDQGPTCTAFSTDGLIWTLGPLYKATAAQVSFDSSMTDMGTTGVQDSLVLLATSWETIKQQIFGD